MKIRLMNNGGFKELECISFPVDVEVHSINFDKSIAYVSYDTLMPLMGHVLEIPDKLYIFLRGEFDLIYEVDNVSRKDLLLSLVKEYGDAINNGNYESECGSIEVMLACHEEEKRLLKEITKMINDGV